MTVGAVSDILYQGNDSTDEYGFPFKVTDEVHLRVVETVDGASGEVLVLGVDYTVAGVGLADGGTLTRTAGNLPTGTSWYIERVVPVVQEIDLRNNAAPRNETIERMVDSVVWICQQLTRTLTRAITLPLGETVNGVLPPAAARKGKFLYFEPVNGDPTVTGAVAISTYPIINVIDYGADPLGANDSQAAFQAAVDALPLTGGQVFAPEGDYKMEGGVNLAGSSNNHINVSIVGAGFATHVRLSGTARTTVSATGDGTQSPNVFYAHVGSGFQVHDLWIEGNQATGGVKPRQASPWVGSTLYTVDVTPPIVETYVQTKITGEALDTTGASNIIVNGDFGTAATWVTGAGWAISGGKATKTAGVASAIYQDFGSVAVIGSGTWEFRVKITGSTAGTLTVGFYSLGDVLQGTAVIKGGNYHQHITLTGNGAGQRVKITASADFDGSIDDVVCSKSEGPTDKVYKLLTNHTSNAASILPDVALGYWQATTDFAAINGYWYDESFNRGMGIYFGSLFGTAPVTGVGVSNVKITNCIFAAILGGSGPVKAGIVGGNQDCAVDGILIRNCDIDTSSTGIGGAYRKNCAITGCQVKSNSNCINVDQGGSHNTISGCVLRGLGNADTARNGVSSYQSSFVVVSGCDIDQVDTGCNFQDNSAAQGDGGSITGCTFNGGNVAISISGSPATTAVGNCINYTRGSGIVVRDSENSTIGPNAFNYPGTDSTSRGHGMEIINTYGVRILGTVRGAGRHGILLQGVRSSTISVTVFDNNVENEATDINGNPLSGICLETDPVSGAVCDGNIITACFAFDTRSSKQQRYGIHFSASSINNTIMLCDFNGNLTGTVNNLGGNSNVFAFNKYAGNNLNIERNFVPTVDDQVDIGAASLRFNDIYVNRVRPGLVTGGPFVTAGTGSPEGVVTAPSGSFYLRDSGTQITSVYFKHTGSGNTGWGSMAALLTGSTVWDPPSIAAGAQASTTIAVPGAAFGDACTVAAPYDLQLMQATAYISSAGNATILLRNGTAGAIDLPSGTWRLTVAKGN